MLKQPESGRVMTPTGLAEEAKNIKLINEALGDIELTPAEESSLIWLAGWERSTVKNIISAFSKASKNV